MRMRDLFLQSGERMYELLADRDASAKSVRLVCAAAALLGALIFMAIAAVHEGRQWDTLMERAAEHGASALIVAAFMGMTYEVFLDRVRRSKHSDELLRAMADTTQPEKTLALLADIVEQVRETPTLFPAARLETREYKFIKDHSLLRQLLLLTEASSHRSVLAKWLDVDSHPNLKFLASDVVGLFGLKRYARTLGKIADEKLATWDALPSSDKWWVLNYKWAAARCELIRYQSLQKLLMTTTNANVQKWLLFIPCQMPDANLCPMVARFLDERGELLPKGVLRVALDALVHLDSVVSQAATIERYKPLFQAGNLNLELENAFTVVRGRDEADRDALRRWQKDARRRGEIDIKF